MSARQLQTEEVLRNFFSSHGKTVLTRNDLQFILRENRRTWKLRNNLSVNEFIRRLLDNHLLQEIEVKAPEYGHSYVRYSTDSAVSIYHLALSLRPNAFFSHQTAMFFHGLTDRDPSLLYVNAEQSKKTRGDSSLSQEGIDRAFQNHARKSNYFFHHNDLKICLLSGMNTGNLGVEEIEVDGEALFATNLERTLIDIVVRPAYAGGCAEVLRAFTKAKDKVSADRMIRMLKKINYVYPYHQAIGFYMQRAGFDDTALNKLKKLGSEFDFYLDYAMKKKEFSEEWKIYHPSSL